jgi:peptidoglycan/LPS O-acetylase OafA/YrhL
MLSAYAEYRSTKFFASLDGLRALSICGVVWTHAWFGTSQYQAMQRIPILRSGPKGVDLFFAISGFLITTLLLRERQKFGTISLKDFYIRRTLRIWPIYYGVLALYVGLVLLTEHDHERKHAFFYFLPTYLTFTYTWFWGTIKTPGVIFNFAWSLSTEEQFYVVWPFVLKFMNRFWPVAVMAVLIAVRVVVGFGFGGKFLPENAFAYRIILSVAVPICAGAILAHVLHWQPGYNVMYYILGSKLAAPLALVVSLASIASLAPAWQLLMWVSLPLLVGACVIREDNGLAKLLRLRPVAFIGVVSYGMYLYNTLVVKAFRPALARIGVHHPLMAYPVILAITVFVAWLSFRYFESPFLALKTRFSRLRPAPATLAEVQISSPEIQSSVHP